MLHIILTISVDFNNHAIIIHTPYGVLVILIYLEDLSVWVSLKDGLDGHREGRPSLTKRVGILVRHPVATPLALEGKSSI